jgi:hypothetical protein
MPAMADPSAQLDAKGGMTGSEWGVGQASLSHLVQPGATIGLDLLRQRAMSASEGG